MEFFAPMLVLIVGALVIGSIFRSHFANKRLRENAKAFAELQGRLIDKFGDAAEVVRYLESDAGKQLLAGAESGRGGAHGRILDAVQTGIVTMLAGVGLLAAHGVSNAEVGEVMRTLGIIAILLGGGFALSAGISWFLLKSWGQLGDGASRKGGDDVA